MLVAAMLGPPQRVLPRERTSRGVDGLLVRHLLRAGLVFRLLLFLATTLVHRMAILTPRRLASVPLGGQYLVLCRKSPDPSSRETWTVSPRR